MVKRARRILMVVSLLCGGGAAQAAVLVYQGQLSDSGAPANGLYDLRLTPHAHATGGAPLAPAVTFDDVPVDKGKFRVEVDFGAQLPADAAPWLEVAVRDGASSGDFSVLGAREKALEAALIGQCWSTTGDSGSNPATNFLGTTDAQPLVLRVENQRVVRYEPNAVVVGEPFTANVIAGGSGNSVTDGVRGATLSGGGMSGPQADPNIPAGSPNIVTDVYGTVAGGYGNRAGNEGGNVFNAGGATVGGGTNNTASGYTSTVAGGIGNDADGQFSTVAGGNGNLAAAASSTVGGGNFNKANGSYSTVGGGADNGVGGAYSTVAGGRLNCAGGTSSFSGGSRAKVRIDNSGGPGCGIVVVANSGDADGDEGTFAWADDSNKDFVSTGPDQFLIRSSGGLVLQPQIGSETTARIPRAMFNVVTGSSGVQLDDNFAGNTIAVFERNTNNFVRILAPSTFERGVLFGDETQSAAAGIIYNGSNMQFRVGNNDIRMVLGTNGSLTLNSPTAIKTNGGTWDVPSDARLKSAVQPLAGALDDLLKLRGVRFQYTHPDNGIHPPGEHVGFLAQEVQDVFPEWVGQSDDGYLTVGAHGFEALTVEALRELKAGRDAADARQAEAIRELGDANAALQAQNAGLKDELEQLARRLAQIEAQGAR